MARGGGSWARRRRCPIEPSRCSVLPRREWESSRSTGSRPGCAMPSGRGSRRGRSHSPRFFSTATGLRASPSRVVVRLRFSFFFYVSVRCGGVPEFRLVRRSIVVASLTPPWSVRQVSVCAGDRVTAQALGSRHSVWSARRASSRESSCRNCVRSSFRAGRPCPGNARAGKTRCRVWWLRRGAGPRRFHRGRVRG